MIYFYVFWYYWNCRVVTCYKKKYFQNINFVRSGLIYLLVLQVKLLLKEACILNVKRDEFEVKYNNFMEKFGKLSFGTALFIYRLAQRYRVRVTRFLWCIHISVFGCCLCSIIENDNVVINLLTVKPKIVPNKKLNVAKLELMSFLLWSHLIVSVRKAFSDQVKISNVVSWSDSKFTLYWLTSVTKKWKIWVENLVSEIKENLDVDFWHYVPTDCNSADVCYKI